MQSLAYFVVSLLAYSLLVINMTESQCCLFYLFIFFLLEIILKMLHRSNNMKRLFFCCWSSSHWKALLLPEACDFILACSCVHLSSCMGFFHLEAHTKCGLLLNGFWHLCCFALCCRGVSSWSRIWCSWKNSYSNIWKCKVLLIKRVIIKEINAKEKVQYTIEEDGSSEI